MHVRRYQEKRHRSEPVWPRILLDFAPLLSRLSVFASSSYLEIKDKAKAVERLYADSCVKLPTTCDLAGLISDVKLLSDLWFIDSAKDIPGEVLFRACQFEQISDAILLLRGCSERSRYLSGLTSGTLDPFERKRSKAKDVLWELELWELLRRRSLDATLAEPPDIIVNFQDVQIGIA